MRFRENKKKILAAVLVLVVAVQMLCACEKQSPAVTNKVYLGVACYNQSDTFLSEWLVCVQEELGKLEEAGLKTAMTIVDAAGSQRTQDDQVKELIDAGCNVLCVNLADRTDTSTIIDLARDSELPVIFFYGEPVAEDMEQWEKLYYVGTETKQAGELQGELAAETIEANKKIDRNKDGKIQYVALEGEPGHQDAIVRTENAVDTLKNKGVELDKLGYGIANWNRAQAENRMMQMISQYRNKIELVLANSDDMALGAIDAYEKLNYTESNMPVFFGIDGTRDGLEAVKDLRLAGTVYHDKEGMAEVIAELSAALVTGEGMDKIPFENGRYIYLHFEKVTKDNVDRFMEEE